MNIYQPYEVLADTNECLHLKENESKESPRFVKSKVVPILLIMLVWLVLQQVGALLPMGWNYSLIAVALLVAAIFVFRQCITEIKIINKKEIFLVITSAFGNKKVTIPVANIKAISLTRKRKKVNEALFKINLRKPDVSYLLLNVPFSDTDEHHIKLIKGRLEDLLQITITKEK
ncbi:hypothetical protein BH10BAC2_BH10BAC2_28280 [soil metagenome]